MYKEEIIKFLSNYGLNSNVSGLISSALIIISISVIVLAINFITRNIILSFFKRIAKSTSSTFDDLLIKNRVPRLLSFIPSLFFLYLIIPTYTDNLIIIIEALTILLFIVTVKSILSTVKDYFKLSPSLKHIPIDSYIQVIMIFLWFIGIILILSVLTGREIGTFLASLGALSAIIILVFRDTILGFVSSIQITVNDTVRIGDWITMKGSDADGTVIEVNLSTVKVQNFDNTITTIPTYKLVSDSFVNWRGMEESKGRRIKRSLLIKPSSIGFLKNNEIDELKKVKLITEYLNTKIKEIDSYNQKNNADKSMLLNGRNLTNLGVFRVYIEQYLKAHPMTNDDLTMMCRQLEPTSQGIPIQIYAFSKDKEWTKYEALTSDIFDHLLSSVKYFNLECFELNQYPSN
ncbi:MAG: mechanosensitive ion channel family protein [Candidatus Marisimplicoccus sp.]|jgi:miniconductance mechanosensitive channel|nr:mechanosensitive ion channel protein MscS [Flavobacteriaceae bacterium]MBT7739833.1 mechanosensitive ion channel [Cryomorphaceae bacterium]RZO99688.1 MAG: mechanosensitive ion channel [Flavobacteriales bacterium]